MTKYGTSAEPVSWHASIECNIYAKITVLWNKILYFIEEYDIINTHHFFLDAISISTGRHQSVSVTLFMIDSPVTDIFEFFNMDIDGHHDVSR